MKKSKATRMLALLMGMLLVLSMAACGNKTKVDDKGTDSKSTEVKSSEAQSVPESTQEEPKEIVEIKVIAPIGYGMEDTQKVVDALNVLLEEKIGVRVDLEALSFSDYDGVVNMKYASGEEFDVIWACDWTNDIVAAVNNEVVMEISDAITKYCPKLYDTMPEFYWELSKINGGLYAVPNMQSATASPGLVVQKELADKYGLDPEKVKSVSDMEDFWDALVENEKDIWSIRAGLATDCIKEGFSFYGTSTVISYDLDDMYNTDKWEVKPIWELDGWVDQVYKIHEWYEKGYIRSDVASVMSDAEDVKAGKYATFSYGWTPGADVTVSTAYGKEYYAIRTGTAVVGTATPMSAMWAISANSEKVKAALDFIYLLHTDKEVLNMLTYGIEGEHYTWVDEDHIRLAEGVDMKFKNDAWVTGDVYLAYLLEGNDEDVKEQQKAYGETLPTDPLAGFLFNSENVKTQVAQLATVWSEFANMRSKGTVDVDTELPKFIERMKGAGVEDVVKEVDRQLQEFLANKKK